VRPDEVPARQEEVVLMQSMSWTAEQSAALRDYVAAGLSFSRAAGALNAKFGTCFTRSAVLGRARRMKLAMPAGPERGPTLRPPKLRQAKAPARQLRAGRAEEIAMPPAMPDRPEPLRLRCVGIRPRLVSLVELAPGDCRYPYGGDREGEAISFCGHPRFRGSSYCAPHFHLTRGPRIDEDRPAGPFGLRLVEAA
jgi:GcrA cell cycle regulator